MPIHTTPNSISLEQFLRDFKKSPALTAPLTKIQFHLDVPDSSISPQTLADIACGLQEIIDTIFEETLPQGVKGEVLLTVPKEGCFEADYVIYGVATCLAVQIANKAVPAALDAFCKEMLGYSITEIATIMSKSTAQKLKHEFLIYFIVTSISLYLNRRAKSSLPHLNKYPKEKIKLQKGKNKTYKTLHDNPAINSISYDGHQYIPRNSFNEYINTSIEDFVDITHLSLREGLIEVVSPVSFTEKTQRGWAGNFFPKPNKKELLYFSINDDNFKKYAATNKLKPAVEDVMKVQMLHLPSEKIKYQVLRVIEFNNVKISHPLTKEEMLNLNLSCSVRKTTSQPNLLDFCED